LAFNANNTKEQIWGSKVLGAIHNTESDDTILKNLHQAINRKVMENSSDPNANKKGEFLISLISEAFGKNNKDLYKLKSASTKDDKQKFLKSMIKNQFYVSQLKESINRKLNKVHSTSIEYPKLMKAKNIINRIEDSLRMNSSKNEQMIMERQLGELNLHDVINQMKNDFKSLSNKTDRTPKDNSNLLYKLKSVNKDLNKTIKKTE
jgi:hypothetical protein